MILLSSETLWAEHGLTGLVIGAFFCLIGIFLKMMTKKDHIHTTFISTILEDERKSREKAIEDDRAERSMTRKENVKVTSKLAEAIDELAKEIARHKER